MLLLIESTTLSCKTAKTPKTCCWSLVGGWHCLTVISQDLELVVWPSPRSSAMQLFEEQKNALQVSWKQPSESPLSKLLLSHGAMLNHKSGRKSGQVPYLDKGKPGPEVSSEV